MKDLSRQLVLSIVILTMLLPGVSASLARPVSAASNGPSLLQSDDTGLVFDLTVALPAVTTVSGQGHQFQRLSLPGYHAWGEPGQPELLETAVVIGIPPVGDISVRVLESQVEELPGRYTIYPLPARQAQIDPASGRPDTRLGLQQLFVWDRAAYGRDGFRPAEVVAVDETAFVRQQRIARIAIRPVQYDAARGVLRVHRYLRVEVSFSGVDASVFSTTTPAADDAFEPLLRQELLNYQQARQWRLARQSRRDATRGRSAKQASGLPAAYPGDTGHPWLKTAIRESGLYQVTPADLQATRLAGVNPAYLQVWRGGRQIPADFQGDGDSIFEEGEALIFYAEVPFSQYSRSAMFWLTAGDEPGQRMAAIDGSPAGLTPAASFPATLHLEDDVVYRNELPLTGDPDYPRWYWQELYNLFTPSMTIPFVLPDVVTAGYSATLQIRLLGVTYLLANPDHHVAVALNGQPVGDVIWDGQSAVIGTLDFPASALQVGDNEIVLSLPGDLPGVFLERAYVDWLTLGYRRTGTQASDLITFEADGSGPRQFELPGFHSGDVLVYDITEGSAPQRVTSVQVLGAGGKAVLARPAIPAATVSASDHRLYLPAVPLNAMPGQYKVSFGTSLAGTRRYVVASRARVRPVWPLVVDSGSDLRATDRQADYLLITHRDFLAAAHALASYRQSTGLNVTMIDVEDIFDEFGDGDPDPGAIRDFIDYAYHNWPEPAPTYVLLLGDGYYDYRLMSGQTTYPNYIPPYYGCFDPWLCEVASDNELVAVSGDDRLPDLLIGRVPAYDIESANRMIAKIIDYETAAPDGDWRSTLTFVADNAYNAQGQPDPAGNFENLTEGVISLLPDEFTADRVYFDPYPADDAGESYRYRSAAATTQAIQGAIDDGRLFVNYTGHAGNNVWAHEWIFVGKGRRRNDVQYLTNGDLLPIFLDMACLTGNFGDVSYVSMQETLLDKQDGGSVGGWAATGFGVATGHDSLNNGFYSAIFQQDVNRLGAAAAAGKLRLWNERGSRFVDLLDTFGLLGDPALTFNLPDDG